MEVSKISGRNSMVKRRWKRRIIEHLSLRIGDLKGQLFKRTIRTARKQCQKWCSQGWRDFSRKAQFRKQCMNTTKKWRRVEGLKSPLDLAVNSNTVSTRWWLQTPKSRLWKWKNWGGQDLRLPRTNVFCYCGTQHKSLTPTALPANASSSHQPGEPLVGRYGSNSSSYA